MTMFVDVVGRGPNLTLLHGWGLNGAVWNGVREALAQHYTLHIIDLPGHGRSSGAPVTTLDAFVDAVAHAMPQHTHLLGWSLGGHTAMALTHRYPERVDKLITVCATPRFTATDDWPQGKKPEVLADFAKRLSTSYAATIRNFLALQALGQPEMRDVIRAMQEAVGAHGAPSVESLAASLDILRVSDIREKIPQIKTPALIVQGDHDALTSTASAQWLAEHLPNSTWCLIEHAAHAPFLSHREVFLEHLQSFLAP
ncbi:MAG: pimeloyl-ACP methyl ester esterase BioH [Betaproteobacteria bacterium]|nr:pimeloyl-ACP methyl ester esterase BioH [Betaproteobacteria bacterium]